MESHKYIWNAMERVVIANALSWIQLNGTRGQMSG